MNRILIFLREVKIELKKVTWPTRQEVIHYTLIIILVSAIAAMFLGGFDALFGYVLRVFVL